MTKDKIKKICIYLRKSRADEEVEKMLGQGETLRKHKKALLKYAKEKGYTIVDIKEELVSADSLFHRPQMLELIKEMKEGLYDGVLVMDLQRLVRGDMEDQGVIIREFKETHTLMITPQRTYDLDNEFDEEYVEFEFFMGRKEYKMINRRMQGARIRSVEEGNYIGTNPPLGYDIRDERFFRTLKINQDEAEIVRLIFNMYTNGNGAAAIAEHLNALGYKTKPGNKFTNSSVLAIIRNPVYIGKVTWKKREYKKSKDPGKVKDVRTRDKSEWIVADGKHEPIIDIEVFEKAQEILKGRYHIPYQLVNGPTNPLAGVVICSKCGNKMIVRPVRGIIRLMCIHKCGNISNTFKEVEKEILDSLDEYLKDIEINITSKPKVNTSNKIYENKLAALHKELQAYKDQEIELYNLLERKIYSEEKFLERSAYISLQSKEIREKIKSLETLIDKDKEAKATKTDAVVFKKLLDGYKHSEDIAQKNTLMKLMVYKIEYEKTEKGKEFEIRIYPKLKQTSQYT